MRRSPVLHTPTEDVRQHLIGDALRRYWALILLCAVVFGAAAGVFAAGRSSSYVASARVLLRPTVGNPFSPDSMTSSTQVTIAIETEATVVDSQAVANLSNKTLKRHWTPGSGTVAATVPSNTQVLVITFKAPSAQQAQAGAQSVAKSFLAYRQGQSLATIHASSAVLNRDIARLTGKLAAAEGQTNHRASSTGPSNSTPQVQLMTSQLVSLRDTLSQLQASDTSPGAITSNAKLPNRAAGVSAAILIGIGALVGLLVGLVLAIVLTRRDKRLRRSATVVHDIPVLAVIGGGGATLRGRGANRDQHGSALAYQRLRLGVLAACSAGSSIAVSGLSHRDEVGDVAGELAASFRRAAYRVVLVIAASDTAASSSAGDAGEPGLSDVLLGVCGWREALVERDGIEVLPPGREVDAVQERFSGDRFRALLGELAASYDYVFVVAPPTTTPAGVAVARAAHATLLVGRELRTTSVDVEDAAEQAELVGARVIGLTLRARASRSVTRRPGTSPSKAPAIERADGARRSAESDGAAAFADVPEHSSAPAAESTDQDGDDIGLAEASEAKVGSSSGNAPTPGRQDQASGRA